MVINMDMDPVRYCSFWLHVQGCDRLAYFITTISVWPYLCPWLPLRLNIGITGC